MNDSVLNKSKNWFTINGVVSEKASLIKGEGRVPMFIEDTEIDEYDENGKTGDKIKCKRLFGVVSLKTSDGVMDVGVNFKSKTSRGADNKTWAMAEKIMDWIPEIGEDATGDPDMVTMSGSVSIYDNFGKDGKHYPTLQFNASQKCQHISMDFENTGCTLSGTAYVKAVKPEMFKRGDDMEETGRYIAECYGADNRGQVFPIDIVVDGDEAIEFMTDDDMIGATVAFEANRVKRHVGGKKSSTKKVFGQSKADTSSGFDVEELILVSAEIIEEPEIVEDEEGNEIPDKTGWLNPVAVKKALKERAKMLDELKSNSGEKTSSKTDMRAAKKAYGAGKAKSSVFDDFDNEDDEDSPF